MAQDEILVLGALPPEVRDALAGRFALVRDGGDAGDVTRFRAAVTTSIVGADAAMLERLLGIKVLGCVGVGLDRIDVAAAERLGIVVCNTPDAVRRDTADAAVALVFATVRRVAEADRFVRAGRWGAERMGASRRVSGMKAGVVGLGHIGAMAARSLVGCGLEVAYTGPREKPGAGLPYIEGVEALAVWCDVLVLCCPGGEATRGLVSGSVLRALGPDGYLVNVARGSVVDEGALLAALERGGIAGAGLDVFAEEPGLDGRFRALENVVLMPHYATVTRESRGEMGAILLAGLGGAFS